VGFSAAYRERMARMAEFIAALQDAGGHLPMIGDADDARMVRLGEPDADPYRSLLASCALLFGRGDFKHKAGALDVKTRMLFGADAPARWQALASAPAAPRMAFPQGGYYLLGADFDTPREVRLVADCGPLGYLAIAAHGHADALAFTLSLGGRPMLIDPGTYAYHTQKAWRDWFRGTSAHNTVRVDGADQSEIGGNFMWLRKANARLLRHRADAAALQVFEGEHDGYGRGPDPVRHQRTVTLDAAAKRIVVTDVLDGRGEHDVEVFWHFDDAVAVELAPGGARARGAAAHLALRCEAAGFEPCLLHGSESPIGGWLSRRFDEKTPTTTLVLRGRMRGHTTITTNLDYGMTADPTPLKE